MNDEPSGIEAFARRIAAWFDAAESLAAGRTPADESAHADPVELERLKLINEVLEKRVAERTGMLRVLHDVTTIANESKTIDEAFRRVLRRVAEHNGWCFGHLYIVARNDPDLLVRSRAYFEEAPDRFQDFIRMARSSRLRRGESLPGRVLESGEAAWVTNVADELAARGLHSVKGLDVKSAAAFPVKVDDQVLAVFEFLSDKEVLPDQRVLDSMASIGTHLGLFIIRKRMKRTIEQLTTLEQQRIGRDLHDDLGQQLTGIALLAKSLERDLRDETSKHAPRVAEIAQGLKDAQTHVRMLARGLAPVEIEANGLMKALADLAQSSRARFELDVRFEPNVGVHVRDNEIATALYRIAQEAVTNSAKHGKASEIVIGLATTEDEVVLEVRDNGIGVSDSTIRRLGYGMSTMVYRANVIGGELIVDRGPNGGTIVRCIVANEDELPDGEYIRDN